MRHFPEINTCTWVCVYPTRVYVLKHLKKINLLNFGWRSRVLPVDYLLVPVAQLFPTNSQLKNYFGRSIKSLQLEGLREEIIERKITLLRLSMIRFEDPFASNTSPITGNPCFLELWCLFTSWDILVWVMEGAFWRLGIGRIQRTVPLGAGERLRSYFSTSSIAYFNKKECCSVSGFEMCLCIKFML